MEIKPGTQMDLIWNAIKDWVTPFTLSETLQALGGPEKGYKKSGKITWAFRHFETMGLIEQTGEKRKAPGTVRTKEKLWILTKHKKKLTAEEIEMVVKKRELIRTEDRNGQAVEVWYDGKPMTKEEAQAADSKTYFIPDMPCLRHHISERWTQNGGCVACQIMRSRQLNKERKGGAPEGRKLVNTPNAANLTRGIVAAIGDKGFTYHTIAAKLKEAGKDLDEKNVRQYIGRAIPRGEIINTKKKMGKMAIYKPGPKFWEYNAQLKQLFLKEFPDLAVEIQLNFDKQKKYTDVQEQKKSTEQEAVRQAVEMPEFKLEETPISLVGRAIWEYILQLRDTANYQAFQDKIDTLKRDVAMYRNKWENAVEANRELSKKHDQLMRKYHEAKTAKDTQDLRISDLQEIIKRNRSGNFSLGEMATIRDMFPKNDEAHP